MRKAKQWLKNILIGLDQLANAILGGNPDECISTRAYDHYPRIASIINWLFQDENHCKHSKEFDNKEIEIIK